MESRRLIRWVLLVIPLLTIGVHLLPAAAAGPATSFDPTPAGRHSIISAPRQSLPLPVHDEATCAFCQAAAFAPHGAAGAGALHFSLGAERREAPSYDDRRTHSGSTRPPRSRAPPALRFV
jgi:hypothetical protein